MERTRKACSPLGRSSASTTTQRALIGGLEAVAAQTCNVQEHVSHAIVRDDEPEPPWEHLSNHLITPEICDDDCCRIAGNQITKRLAFPVRKPVPGPLGPIAYAAAMRTRTPAAKSGASSGRFANLSMLEDNIARTLEKNKIFFVAACANPL